MNIKLVVRFSFFILAMYSAVAQGEETDPNSYPNIILITIDTLRADHVGAYGYSRATSPNIDEFSKKGVLFKKAMCNWPKTTPSFVSMLTGTYGSTNGVRGGCRQPMPLELTTIAEVLEEKGFQTAAVSNNPNLSIQYHFNQGFQDFIEIWEESDSNNCVAVTDNTIDWLNKKRKDRAFFLWVHYIAPHTLYEPADPFDGMFVDDELSNATRDRILPINEGRTYHGGINRTRAYLSPYTYLNYYIAQYDGEIAYVDSEVGRLLQEIEELGLDDDSIIVLTSDHGEELGEHGIYFEHGQNVNQSTMHIPLVIAYPNEIHSSTAVDDNVTLLGLFPTILDYAKIEVPKFVEGRSLRDLIDGKVNKQRIIFSEGGYKSKKNGRYHSVIYDNNWKLIHKKEGDYLLYDLATDPDEQVNLFSSKKKIAKKLKKKLTKWESAQGIEVSDKKKNKPKKDKPKIIDLSERTKTQLEALGYIETDSKK